MCVHGLVDSILLRCQFFPTRSMHLISTDSKIYMGKISNSIWKESKFGGLTLLSFKTYNKSTVNETK